MLLRFVKGIKSNDRGINFKIDDGISLRTNSSDKNSTDIGTPRFNSIVIKARFLNLFKNTWATVNNSKGPKLRVGQNDDD